MTVIAEHTLPAGDLVLGRAVREASDEAETAAGDVVVERLVSDGDRSRWYLRVPAPDDGGAGHGDGDDRTALERALAASSVENVERLERVGGRSLLRVDCGTSDPVATGLSIAGGRLLDATREGDRWRLRTTFEDNTAMSEFQSHCVDRGVGLALERLYSPVASESRGDPEMTPRQRDTLLTAYREGYFEVPREATLVDLADELDVSDQAVSERIRRGEAKLIRTVLVDDD